MSFFAQGYKVEDHIKRGGIFLKLEEGATTLRILKPTNGGPACAAGWRSWMETPEGKVVSRAINPPATVSNLAIDRWGHPELKHVWLLAVIDRSTQAIKIWEVPQTTVQTAITELAASFGDPTEFDIVIKKKKVGGKTTYTVSPTPIAPLSQKDCDLMQSYIIQPAEMFNGGKGLVNTQNEMDKAGADGGYSAQAAAPETEPEIVSMLRAALGDGNVTTERALQLQEWALGYIDQFNSAAPDGNGTNLIDSIVKPYLVATPAPAPTPAIAAPVAPPAIATPAQVPALAGNVAVDDLPF